VCVCVCVCVRACARVRACVCVCVCVFDDEVRISKVYQSIRQVDLLLDMVIPVGLLNLADSLGPV